MAAKKDNLLAGIDKQLKEFRSEIERLTADGEYLGANGKPVGALARRHRLSTVRQSIACLEAKRVKFGAK